MLVAREDLSVHTDRRAWYVLGVLFLIYVCSTADRHILSILAVDIQRELHLSDTQLGLMTGPAIALLYGIMSVPVAHLADRLHRVRLLAICLGLWSIFTGLGSLAGNAFQLALSRIGVSVAEGGGMPVSASILADYFKPERRPLALTLYSMSAMVGIFVSFGIGGTIAASHGWRVALIAAAVPGLLLCPLLMLTVREPRRGATDDVPAKSQSAPPPLFAALHQIFADRFFRIVLVGSSLTSFASAAALAWAPTLAMRKFGAGAAEVGGQLGLVIAVLGAVSMILGGIVADRLLARHARAALYRFVALAQLAAIPLLGLALVTASLTLMLVLLGAFYAMMHLYVAAYWAAASVMPSSIRATTSAVGVLTLIVVGSGVGPPVIGMASDAFQSLAGKGSLAWAITLLIPVVTCSSLAFLRAANLPLQEIPFHR